MPLPKKVNRMAMLQKELEAKQHEMKASSNTHGGSAKTDWRKLFKNATPDQKRFIDYMYGSWTEDSDDLLNKQKSNFGAAVKNVVAGDFCPVSGVMMTYFKQVKCKDYPQHSYRSDGCHLSKPKREPQTVNWGVSDRSGMWTPAANLSNPSQSRTPSTWDRSYDCFSSTAEINSLLKDPRAADYSSNIYMGSASHGGKGGIDRAKLMRKQDRDAKRERRRAARMRRGKNPFGHSVPTLLFCMCALFSSPLI